MAKNVTVTPADGDIQFQNTSGTDAGKIAQDGDNLVITNAVGDILFGDTNADVYIGDGVNSVDVLFEVSGAIKAEDGSTGVALTLGSSDTTLSLYAPKITNISTQSSEATALMINGSNVVGTRELGSAAFSASTAFVAVGGDTMTGALRIQEGASDQNNTSDTTTIPSTTGVEFLKIEGGYTDGRYTTEFAKIDRGGNLPLYIRQSKSTANSFVNLARFGDHSNSVHEFEVFGSIKASGGDSGNWNTAYGWGNHASAGYLTTETYTGTVTSVTVGTGLDVSNGTTTPNITLDLSELTDMTASVNTSQDELILLDNGAERRKVFSEIFGSAAYSNTSAFAAASHNHDSSYPAKSDSYISLFSDQWQDTPEGKYVTISLPYMSGSGSSGYYIFDVFGYRDIGSMDSLVNYRVYAHVRSDSTEENDVKFHVYTLHEAAGEEFEFAYKVNAGSATSVYIYIEEDYSGLEIFGIPVTEGSLNLTTSGMISISETAPTGTTQIVRQVAHPNVGTTAGTYGNTANGTKIDTITIDEHGHVTGVATGATGNMTGFFVEDGDGTEVQINNANEWKFVEGTGIDINWTDTSNGNDSDPYDLTFAIKNNSIGITQLNVSDGTNGQVLTTNGNGTLSFSTVTSGSSYGWSLNGTDIESGDGIALAGGLSLSGTGGSYTLTSANDNTTYTAGTGLTLSGTEFSVTANTYATAAQGATADAALPKAGGTMTGDLTVSSGTNGDSKIIIESDTDNNNEDDNPQLHFKQDGGLVNAYAGLVGTGGNIFTDSVTNAAYFGVTNDVPLQLFTNNTSRLTINGNGTVKLEAYGAGILKTDANGLISLDTSTYLTAHPNITAASSSDNNGRTYIQDITLDSNGHVTGIATATETVTNTNTTYSAGSGLDLTSTTFSVEADLRDGITHVGKDNSNYIQFDSTNGRIDFYAGGNFVARLESDGDLHVKGDVIAFSDIFG